MNKYKTFWPRIVAALIDALVFLPYSFIEFKSETFQLIYSTLLYTLVVSVYFIYCHGKWGQTLGKRVANIKVLDLGEQSVIGYRRAFYRELPWIVSELILFVWAAVHSTRNNSFVAYESAEFVISLTWISLELLSMLLNNKRRAIHDLFAGSVVIKIDR